MSFLRLSGAGFRLRRWQVKAESWFAWLLVGGVSAFLVFGFLWMSHIPQFCLLAIFGREASGAIVKTESVRYASFPYHGVVHTVEFRTARGETRRFERTGDYVPPELTGSFSLHYLPLWPKVALIDEEPRLSGALFLVGLLCAVPFCFVAAFSSQTRRKAPWILRPFRAVGLWIEKGLERVFDN